MAEAPASEPFEAELEMWSNRVDAPEIEEILQSFALPGTLAVRIEPPLKMLVRIYATYAIHLEIRF